MILTVNDGQMQKAERFDLENVQTKNSFY